MTSSGPGGSFFDGCAELAMLLWETLFVILFFVAGLFIGAGQIPPLQYQYFQVGPGPGPGGGPGGGATATPTPFATATPAATPQVTPLNTPAPTPTPTPAGGGGGGGSIPPISSRSINGGEVHASVSGFFSVDADVAINPVTSSAGEFETWLYYGTTELQTVRVGIFLGEPQYVQVSRATFTAQSQGNECVMQVNVTGSSISGHISCTGVSAYDLSAGTSGTVTIELDFTADS